MKSNKNLLLVMSLILVLTVFLPALADANPNPAERPKGVRVRIVGLYAGTSMQLRAEIIAEALRREYPDWKIQAIAAVGRTSTHEWRRNKEVDLFLNNTTRPMEIEAYRPAYKKAGLDVEKAIPDYDVIMFSSWKIEHFITKTETGITSFKDIIDKRYPAQWCYPVPIENPLMDRYLAFYGTSWKEMATWGVKIAHQGTIGTPGPWEYVRAGTVDVANGWMGLSPIITEVGATLKLRMLPFGEEPELLEKFKELGLDRYVFKPGVYPFVKEPVKTIALPEPLCVVRGTLTDDVVYWITRGIWNQRDFMISGYAGFEHMMSRDSTVRWLSFAGIDTAPGAKRFYQEMGFYK